MAIWGTVNGGITNQQKRNRAETRIFRSDPYDVDLGAKSSVVLITRRGPLQFISPNSLVQTKLFYHIQESVGGFRKLQHRNKLTS